ncbi:Imm26 family immunity protein [Zooshikella ganghwensis]|uniref:Imm26 family immunity protein n=1 Tax=Zooshikella ganghwensis TaxID=202772 RepID=UPI00040F5352|nr:Imm26 family immunity protein [Zooshikella ganghwensis]
MKRKQKYKEGDLFVVPLLDGTTATGIIARMTKRRGAKGILGYFFDQSPEELLEIEKSGKLSFKSAVFICRFGDLGLHEESWTVSGSLKNWNPDDWPVPEFCHQDALSGKWGKRLYSEELEHLTKDFIPITEEEASTMPQDGFSGADAVIIKLTKLLRE